MKGWFIVSVGKREHAISEICNIGNIATSEICSNVTCSTRNIINTNKYYAYRDIFKCTTAKSRILALCEKLFTVLALFLRLGIKLITDIERRPSQARNTLPISESSERNDKYLDNRKKKLLTRFLSLFLAFVMVFTSGPLHVLADYIDDLGGTAEVSDTPDVSEAEDSADVDDSTDTDGSTDETDDAHDFEDDSEYGAGQDDESDDDYGYGDGSDDDYGYGDDGDDDYGYGDDDYDYGYGDDGDDDYGYGDDGDDDYGYGDDGDYDYGYDDGDDDDEEYEDDEEELNNNNNNNATDTVWYSIGGQVITSANESGDENNFPAPLADAEVSLFFGENLMHRAFTDDLGQYSFEVMPFSIWELYDWHLVVEHEGFEAQTARVSDYLDSYEVSYTGFAHLNIDFQLDSEHDASLEAWRSIGGQVTAYVMVFSEYDDDSYFDDYDDYDYSGFELVSTPLENAMVSIFSGEDLVGYVLTDEDGLYNFEAMEFNPETLDDWSFAVELEGFETQEVMLSEFMGDYILNENGIRHLEVNFELEQEFMSIVPLSIHTPPGLTTTHVVSTEAQLRTALGATGLKVIRVTQDITLTTASVLPFGGASSTAHIYSDSPDSFRISRGTSTSRHFSLAGSRQLHLWNIALTRTPGPIRADGSTTPGGLAIVVGGGVALTASGTRLFMHSGSEISHNRAAGRGGGIFLDGGQATLNAGSRVYANRSDFASATGPGSGGGGGISVGNGTTLNVNNAVIENNLTTAGHGGGIQAAAGTTGGRAVLNINSIQLLNNRSALNGGGIHSNTNATYNMSGVIIIDGNSANAGGGMRIFSGDATNFNLAPGSRISNNIARQNGAGISIAHTGTGSADSNANTIGLRANGVTFNNNRAVGIGGAIHHEGPDMLEARGIIITDSVFTNNRASDGGAISVVVSSANHNNLPADAPATRLSICANTVFSGNSATNGMLVDENLAAQNLVRIPYTTGSAQWYGPRTDTSGNVLALEVRDHIWNNYDVITRNRMAARTVNFELLGTAAAETTMVAELSRSRRSTNHSTTTVGYATTELIDGPGLPRPLANGEAVIRDSQANFEITYLPWNADVLYWMDTQTQRIFTPGDLAAIPPVEGTFSDQVVRSGQIAGSADTLVQNNIEVEQHTMIQARVNYRYHNIVFNVSPAGTGTLGGEATVTRNLRASRLPFHTTVPPSQTSNGAPIGTPPAPTQLTPESAWRFSHWELDGVRVHPTGCGTAEIAAMPVNANLTFTAVFSEFGNLVVGHRAHGTPDGMTVTVNGNVIAADTAATISAPHDVSIGAGLVLYAGNSPNQTFLGWRTQAEYLALPVNADGNRYIPGFTTAANRTHTATMPSSGLHMIALWGNDDGVISQLNTASLTVGLVSSTANPPVGMSVTANATVVANTTTTSVGDHLIVINADVSLFSGTSERQTFLGWFTPQELADLPTNELGQQYVPNFTPPAQATHTLVMPLGGAHRIAVWGN